MKEINIDKINSMYDRELEKIAMVDVEKEFKMDSYDPDDQYERERLEE